MIYHSKLFEKFTSNHENLPWRSSLLVKLYVYRGGFRVQKKMVTNFCKIDTIYIKVIALIFVVIIVVIIIIANVAVLFLLWDFSSYNMIYAKQDWNKI